MERQKKLFRPVPALLALVAGLALSVAIAGASKTELGGTTNAPTSGFNTPAVAVATVAGSPSYETPDGVLTEWRFHSANEDPAGSIKLKIFRATSMPTKYEVVGDSSMKALDANKSYEFDERIPVQKGDLLGVYGNNPGVMLNTDMMITTPGLLGNVIGQFESGDIPVGSSKTTTIDRAQLRLAIAATVESDADKDGYGDDTQDECPTDAKIHSSKCPKTTTTPKDNTRPKVTYSAVGKQNLIRQRGVFITATSNETGKLNVTATVSIEKVHFSKSYAMIAASGPITAGVKKTVKVGASKKLRRRVKRGFRKHRRIRAHVSIRVTDAAGNRTSKSTTIKIKRRGR